LRAGHRAHPRRHARARFVELARHCVFDARRQLAHRVGYVGAISSESRLNRRAPPLADGAPRALRA
jgi:hypothetical protein